MTPEERNKIAKTKDYFIDTGLSAEEVKEIVSIGDSITREREFIEMGNCVNGKSLDNRLAVFILIETLKNLKDKGSSLRYLRSVYCSGRSWNSRSKRICIAH